MIDPASFFAHMLEFAMAVPAAVIAFVPAYRWLRLDSKRVLVLAAACVALVTVLGGLVCALADCPSKYILLICALVLFVPYSRAVDLSVPKQAFCFANALMLCAFSNLSGIIVSSSWEGGNSSTALLPQTGFTALGFAAAFILLFWRTLAVKLPVLLSYRVLDRVWRWLVLAPVALTVFAYWMVPINPSLVLAGRTQPIFMALVAFVMLAIWLFYHVMWWASAHIAGEAELRQEIILLRAEEKRYRELALYMGRTRELRHDFRHHLLVMRGLANDGMGDELSEYLDQLVESESEGRVERLCANAAVDAVAAYYNTLAHAAGASIAWRLELPAELPIAEADVCAVLGNLVENALNAVRDLPEEKRRIDIMASEASEAALGVTVSNPYKGVVNFGADGLPVAKSPDHGIGLSSVVTTAQKYGGGVDVRASDGEFRVGVVFYYDF